MKKSKLNNLSFWASQLDTQAHIIDGQSQPAGSKVMCGVMVTQDGNNNAPNLEDICKDCLNEYAERFFWDYFDNFINVEDIAVHYALDIDTASELIRMGDTDQISRIGRNPYLELYPDEYSPEDAVIVWEKMREAYLEIPIDTIIANARDSASGLDFRFEFEPILPYLYQDAEIRKYLRNFGSFLKPIE